MVLPAPVGPTTATVRPGATSRSHVPQQRQLAAAGQVDRQSDVTQLDPCAAPVGAHDRSPGGSALRASSTREIRS